MLAFVKQHSVGLILSVILHAGVVTLLSLSFSIRAPLRAAPPQQLAIQARVVDQEMIDREIKALEDFDRREAEQKAKELAELEAKKQAEQDRLAALRKENERAKEAEAKRREDARLQRKAAAAEVKRQQEQEQIRLAELQRQREAEEEAIRVAAVKRKEAEEQERREAADRKQQRELQDELNRAIQEEEGIRAAENAGLLDIYRRAIQAKVERNWIKPPGAGADLRCTVNVSQIPGGDVVDVRIATCNGDAAVQRSIEAAVYRASPLPLPADPRLFDRRLTFEFQPRE